jgi:2-succinyl-5-enolpyruvyl-6-hydroxy-3-cyclohexene-1-carboxylate synthase
MSAAVQTLWSELIASTLAEAGVRTCVVSPGSRSTPLVLALAADGRFELPTIIDERAAAFFALGIARATGATVAMLCTSGSAAAHYLPALVEGSLTGVSLIAITADRPAELQHCGATQTIDQIDLYGSFVRGAFDLGAPVGSPIALRALRRKLVQAVTLARGPHPGPVHIEVPLRKPLEPAAPTTDEERALAKLAAELRRTPLSLAAPRLTADPSALDALAAAIAAEPRGIIIAGALPAHFPRDALFALAAKTGYPLLAESGSQARLGPRPANVVAIDYFDLIFAAPSLAGAHAPRLVIQLGAEPVAAGWTAAQPLLVGATRYVLADHDWRDPDSTARSMIAGDLATSLAALTDRVRAAPSSELAESWRSADARAHGAIGRALASHPRSEVAVMQAVLDAVPANAIVQIGNSLPIRVVDHVRGGGARRTVITQRGAAGIDGLIASAAGATRAGQPVVLVLGDVSFAHDLGGLLAARLTSAPFVIVVLDNGGGRIFSGLPVARANTGAAPKVFAEHFLTAPSIDPAAVAGSLGIRAVTAASPALISNAVANAIATGGPTVIHAPVTATGARDVRRDALELLVGSMPSRTSLVAVPAGASHV